VRGIVTREGLVEMPCGFGGEVVTDRPERSDDMAKSGELERRYEV
jgi:hypothetical protein